MTQITAKILAHSKAPNGQEIVTFELEYPRFIHSELMTHRLFSRNAASSRAIPIEKMISQVRDNPAMPVHWGKNQPGMQAKDELGEAERGWVKRYWKNSAQAAGEIAEKMAWVGAHKQVVNRLLEPYQRMKTVLTTTCPDNFFWLRRHTDADPTIHALANAMWEALQESEPVQLQPGDWHVPYFGAGYWLKDCGVPLEDALAISSSCCAQVSFRSLDDSLEKAQRIYNRLVASSPVHASPFEHCATPIGDFDHHMPWPEGVTHIDRKGQAWSGNFLGFIQYRQVLKVEHTKWN